MRRQKQSDLYFKNQKAKDEQKVVTDRIKDLELQVKENKFKQEEALLDFASKLSKGPQTRADLESEIEMLHKTKAELEILYHEAQEKHQQELYTLDQRFRTINELSEMVRQDRDMKRVQLKVMAKQLDAEREAEKQLDREIESILGRAVT